MIGAPEAKAGTEWSRLSESMTKPDHLLLQAPLDLDAKRDHVDLIHHAIARSWIVDNVSASVSNATT